MDSFELERPLVTPQAQQWGNGDSEWRGSLLWLHSKLVPAETRTQVFCRLVQAAFPSVLPLLSSPKQSEPVSKHLLCAAHEYVQSHAVVPSDRGPTFFQTGIGPPGFESQPHQLMLVCP